MQTKLTEEQISNCRQIAKLLLDEKKTFNWFVDCDYWLGVYERLCEISKHGTSDGKPYVEPEPPIPEGWRKANADEWRRKDVKLWNSTSDTWVLRPLQGWSFDPPDWGTRYIVPIDPPLTDEDACVWPRLLVMVRDNECQEWKGPFIYKGKDDDTVYPFVAASDRGRSQAWTYARRATAEEIEAANGNS